MCVVRAYVREYLDAEAHAELAHRSQRALIIDVRILEISLAEKERQEGEEEEDFSRSSFVF